MAKKYLAFKDDLVSIVNEDLVLEPSLGSTPISELPLGASIYIPETVNHVTTNYEYFIVEKWNNMVTVMRKELTSEAIKSKNYTYAGGQYNYKDSSLNSWLISTFAPKFSTEIKNNFAEKTIKYTDPWAGTLTMNTTMYIASKYEMGLDSSGRGESQWFNSNAERIAYYNGTAAAYYTRDTGYRANTGINSSGSDYGEMFSSDAFRLRPCIVISYTATVDVDNILQPAGKQFEGTVEDIQKGDYYYKFKDIDGRVSSNITYDNTTSGLTATNVKAAIDELTTKTQDFFLVTMTNLSGSTATFDKTVGEILAAFQAGKTVWCNCGQAFDEYYPLVDVMVHNGTYGFNFHDTWIDPNGQVIECGVQIVSTSTSANTGTYSYDRGPRIITVNSSAPSNPNEGTLWIDTSDSISQLKIYHNNAWQYADNTRVPDITISGTFSNSGSDYPDAASIAAADFSTTKTFSELLAKVEADGELILDGCLTKDDVIVISGKTYSGNYKKCCTLKISCCGICDETLTAELASDMQMNIDTNTKMICCRINVGNFSISPPMLCIYLYNNEIQFAVNTQV